MNRSHFAVIVVALAVASPTRASSQMVCAGGSCKARPQWTRELIRTRLSEVLRKWEGCWELDLSGADSLTEPFGHHAVPLVIGSRFQLTESPARDLWGDIEGVHEPIAFQVANVSGEIASSAAYWIPSVD